MPRRRPHELRQAVRPRAAWRLVSHIPGLPAATQAEIAVLEIRLFPDWARHGLWPGAVREALAGWARTAADPRHAEAHPCDCCGRAGRAVLAEVLGLLSPDSAAALTRLIRPLDERFLERSLPDPLAPADWPWWTRICERR